MPSLCFSNKPYVETTIGIVILVTTSCLVEKCEEFCWKSFIDVSFLEPLLDLMNI